MKRPLLFLLFCFPFSVAAQNWQCVSSVRDVFFTVPYSNALRAIHIDSTYTSGSDSVFCNYRCVPDGQDDQQYCFHADDTSWLGVRAIVESDGDHLFFNRANDTILIQANASQGTSWKLHEWDSGNYISADIDSVNYQSVLGVMDSVKTILLNAKDSLNNPMTHALNGKYFRISKNHGILTAFHFLNFPDESEELNIVGIDNSNLGIQNLTVSEIFNIDTGDVFQYSDFTRWGTTSYIQKYIENRVLNKTLSANGDTLTYVLDNMYHHYQFINTGSDTSYFIHDTITYVVSLINESSLNEFPKQVHVADTSWQVVYGFTDQIVDTFYNGRRVKERSDFYQDQTYCIAYPTGNCIFPRNSYAHGLGLVSIYDMGIPGWPCHDYHLIYFRKGTETWGTPLNWSVILNSESLDNREFVVFPNPAKDILTLKNLPASAPEVKIFSLQGIQLWSAKTGNSQEMTVCVKDFARGICILELETATGPIFTRLVLH